ncbi:MAG: sulfatase [Acidimicrobiales bacterium]
MSGSSAASPSAASPDGARMPANVVVVLLDSLNRHLLGSYGGTEFDTPNLDRFAARAVRFTDHQTGSLPCMPARHDLLCGALDFLWRPWGSIEVWEEPFTVPLRRAGVTTMLVTDHPHLFEHGGENYHCDFTAWDYQRGHESDPWRTRPDPSWAGAPAFGRPWMPYDDSRGWFRDEADFPGPRTMTAAADWLERFAPHHDRFCLVVDEFDPHEPFDVPAPWAGRYDPDWDGAPLIWPPYAVDGVARGVLTEREGRQIRANYGAKLSMIDHWFGRILDALDRTGRWDDTAVVVCTDHGHYLGEHDLWGKPGAPVRAPLGHTPLLVAWPGRAPGVCDALTTTVDLHATVLDVFGVTSAHRTHGRSLVGLLDGTATSVRDHVLTGVWGREVHVVTPRFRYGRGPAGADNAPLSMWSNRWSSMPVHATFDVPFPRPDERATLGRMPGSTVPVLRQPFRPGDLLPFWALTRFRGHVLYDRVEDPSERDDRHGSALESEAAEVLRTALVALEAPEDQLVRLGLS